MLEPTISALTADQAHLITGNKCLPERCRAVAEVYNSSSSSSESTGWDDKRFTLPADWLDDIDDYSTEKQEVWPLGSADTVCPRRPLMTQVQHWAKSAYTDHVTLRSSPLRLWRCGWYESSSSICIPSFKFVGLAIQKIWHTMCMSINGLGDLDLETGMRVASKVWYGIVEFNVPLDTL